MPPLGFGVLDTHEIEALWSTSSSIENGGGPESVKVRH